MPYLTRAQALKVDGRKIVDVEFPELKGMLRLAELATGPAQVLAQLQPKIEAGDLAAAREQTVLIIENGIVDEKGDPLFDRASAEDFYNRLPMSALARLVDKLPKDEEAVAQARAEREKKNEAIVAKAIEGVGLPVDRHVDEVAIPSKAAPIEKKA